MAFEGSKNYIASKDLKISVKAAMHLEKPLLIKGEPGTGKTLLAEEIATVLNKPLYTWHIKSTTKAQQGLYEYDAVSRLRDSQLGLEKVAQIGNYIVKGVIWKAFDSEEQSVLLIDEIDKADIEFPNDLLLELDRMEFDCYELQKRVKAKHRPIIIITSNNEKELPDAFLRRCLFHYIQFPDKQQMEAIVQVHFPNLNQHLMQEALRLFYQFREIQGLKKRPSTSELIDWIKLLIMDGTEGDELSNMDVFKEIPQHIEALIKNEKDLDILNHFKQIGGNSNAY